MSFRRGPIRSSAAFCAGLVVAAAIPLAAGELYVREFPPEDFRPYLGDESPNTGPFAPDPAFGVRYRSWQAFKNDYEGRIWPYLPYIEGTWKPKCWAMFGNSFVQAPGMLADTARVCQPPGHERMIFNLGRNEDLLVRLAQIGVLLENGLCPERIFVALLPLDFHGLAQHRLADVHVNARGAITYRPRDPGGMAGWMIGHSRLALTGWVRSGRHYADPSYSPGDLIRGLNPALRHDVEHLFGHLANVTRSFGVPVTVILIPNHEQIARGASFASQDTLTPLFQGLGLDVCDVRAPFLAHADKKALFIPDKHFSTEGNRILFNTILGHLRAISADPETLDRAGGGS